MEDSLKHKTVKGVGWSAVDNVAQYGVTFIVSIVLARLLSPDDYGLIGLTAIFTAVCNTLINAGFTTALIRKKDVTDEDYNTVFIVNLVMSLLLYGIIFFYSPLIADFFQRDELVWLTRVSSLGMIIGALSLVQQTHLTKRIDFKSQTKITIVASISSGIIGIALALMNLGVWALVAQALSSQLIRTVLLWHVNKWVPHLIFSKNSFHELFGFGWKMMVSGCIDTVWKELYQFVVGTFYSPATLGQYTRARQFSQLLSSNLTSVVQRVTYPVLSLIGPKWHEAATYLPLICVVGSTYPLHAINLNMLQVQGRSDIFLGLEIIKKIIATGPLLIGAFVGIFPMLWASVIVNIIAYFLNSYYTGKLLGYSSWMQIKDVAPSYRIATIIALSVFFLKYLPISYWFILPTQILFGIIIFFTLCVYTTNPEYYELKLVVTPFSSKVRNNKRD